MNKIKDKWKLFENVAPKRATSYDVELLDGRIFKNCYVNNQTFFCVDHTMEIRFERVKKIKLTDK